ncbi:class I SAM-dependent methyltransferase [Priestia abyssalis]|uniref:class I SAM-dependent methyltransferase n=1 Tax=Priestia abyssalis TaxID=1221450 RepID=UPI000994EA06|nr:SAM-dependent methyltransferase [Priestia abyssalis]
MIQLIKQFIKQSPQKGIPYSEFMSQVLYHPIHGYYMKDREKVGKEGDFLTTPHIFPVFAKIMARFFSKAVAQGAVPPAICEIGGGDGRFAYHVLREWEVFSPDTFSKLTYYVVEKSSYHQQQQQQNLTAYPKLEYFHSLEELKTAIGSFKGIVFSNEWFDALPVEVIEQTEGELYEVWVSLDEFEELTEVLVPVKNEQIKRYADEYNLQLRDGQRMEVPLVMLEKLKELHDLFRQGMMVTIDYGYTFEELRHPLHHRGSLRGYLRHQLISNPLLHAGQMDLTAHIHLDSFIDEGKRLGAEAVSVQKQHEFLLAIGILDLLQEHAGANPFSDVSKQNRAIRSLVMDAGMSPHFHVIVQEKGIELNKDQLFTSNFLMKNG